MRRRALILAILLALIAAPVLAAGVWRRGTVNEDATTVLRDLIATEHHRACGRDLVHDSQLVWAARWKAQDMGYRGYFAHRDRTGHYTWHWYSRAGVSWRGGAGEIIAWNTYPDAESGEQAFRQFMGSRTHRALIQRCGYERFGVGTFRAGDKRLYAVEFTDP